MDTTKGMKRIIKLSKKRMKPLLEVKFGDRMVCFIYRSDSPAHEGYSYPTLEEGIEGELERLGEQD